MRVSASVFVVLFLLQASCGGDYQFSRVIKGRPGPSGVEFIGLFEESTELVPGLRSARSIHDLKRLLDKSDEPGGTNIRARFRVSKVLSDSGDCLKPGDRLSIFFRSPMAPTDPYPLPGHLVGRQLRVVLHDPFGPRYSGRFSYTE